VGKQTTCPIYYTGLFYMEDIYQVHYVAVGTTMFCIYDVSMRGHKSSSRQYLEWGPPFNSVRTETSYS
jgi:hypothetical protein